MDLLLFLLRSSRRLVIGTMIVSVLGGVLGAALIAVVHRALSHDGWSMTALVAAFIAIALGKIFMACASQIMLVRFAQDTVFRLCRNLCDKVLAVPFPTIERLGAPRIMTTLTDDVAILTAAVQAVPTLATNLAVMAGCAVYLAWLSWQVFLASAVLVLVGAAGYRVLLKRAYPPIQAARDGRDRLFGDFRTLIEGIKELKLNRKRRDEFMRSELEGTMTMLREQNVAAIRQYTYADAWSQFFFLTLIGVLLFLGPAFTGVSPQTLTGYVFAALYTMTPVWTVIGTVPTFMRGRVSLAKIRELGDTLDHTAAEPSAPASVADTTGSAPMRIDFQEVLYKYPASEDGAGFALGPIDLTLASGELVFVTGGNGSGKSTLVKLLTGLYTPQSGRILVNGQPLDDANRDSYRQNFAAVFADFHLSPKLFGIDANARASEISRYLSILHMDSKVSVRDGRFSSIALSTGQRKRLALLTAYLEDRPIYVFDEWAADQDPSYKEVFYMRLLPELKARGKCVVVITHDDRYFSRGDRVIKLEGGRTLEAPVPLERQARVLMSAP